MNHTERQLYLQQLQIRRLLQLTQAINNNADADTLYDLYKQLLTQELETGCFALFIYQSEQWVCQSRADLADDFGLEKVLPYLENYNRTTKLTGAELPELAHFDYVVPIYHKNLPLATVLVKNISAQDSKILYQTLELIYAVTNIIAVAIENKRLFKQQLEQKQLEKELDLAIQMQNMLIPSDLPRNQDYEFAGIYQPHSAIGGDYYDVIKLDESNEIAFCIADISGKGVAAALLMSNFQANLHSLIHRKNLHFRTFIQLLNDSVLKTAKGEKFITFFIARYDFERKRLRYISAGHNPPYMVSQQKISKLDSGCTILGVFPKIPHISLGELYLEDDAFFLLYTDGLSDLQNKEGAYFGENGLESFVLQNYQQPVEKFNELLKKTINEFRGEQQFSDDVSVLTARIFAPSNQN